MEEAADKHQRQQFTSAEPNQRRRSDVFGCMLLCLFRNATADDASAITELAVQSKAAWGYSSEAMRVFRQELTITPADLASRNAVVMVSPQGLVGFYTLVPREHGAVELEHLFVQHTQWRQGIGTKLFRHALRSVATGANRRLLIQSDPHARDFYLHLGASLEQEIPSSIPGRTLPLFGIEIPRPAGPN